MRIWIIIICFSKFSEVSASSAICYSAICLFAEHEFASYSCIIVIMAATLVIVLNAILILSLLSIVLLSNQCLHTHTFIFSPMFVEWIKAEEKSAKKIIISSSLFGAQWTLGQWINACYFSRSSVFIFFKEPKLL